jgi:hypothetical protein
VAFILAKIRSLSRVNQPFFQKKAGVTLKKFVSICISNPRKLISIQEKKL